MHIYIVRRALFKNLKKKQKKKTRRRFDVDDQPHTSSLNEKDQVHLFLFSLGEDNVSSALVFVFKIDNKSLVVASNMSLELGSILLDLKKLIFSFF